ncbi:hypothetical protein [Mycobacterium kyogaense]|uniref:hypothetical protein n=1 Tax=Mycobacterium kyogaense TaxID=2212479 RepID=UPI0013C53568|nr:hypothetical protein [Mycobacterium kyogaense]
MKSAFAVANWAAGMFGPRPDAEQQSDGAGDPVGGALNSLGLPSLTKLIQPREPQATEPIAPAAPAGTPASGVGAGPAPGPMVQYNGTVNMGVDPRAMTQRQNADMNQAYRRNLSGVRPQ